MDRLFISDLLLIARYLNINMSKATMCPASPLASQSLITTEQAKHFGIRELKKIGEGVTGTVFKTDKNYAYKYIDNDANALLEISIMQYLDHPNLACISGMFEELFKYVIVMEVADGTLHDIFLDLKNSKRLRRKAYYQIFSGLAYLHSVFIVHADIKPKNILVYKQGKIYTFKITDFGLSKSCAYLQFKSNTNIVTALWRAPELYENKKFGKMIVDGKIDVWSVGIIMFNIVYQTDAEKYIFDGDDGDEIYENILKNNRNKTDPKAIMPINEGKLVELCLKIDPMKRPTALECLNRKYFKNIRRTRDILEITDNKKSIPPFIKTYKHRNKIIDYIYKSQLTLFNETIIKKISDRVDVFNAAVMFYVVALMDIYMQTEKPINIDFFEKNKKDIVDAYTSNIFIEQYLNIDFVKLYLEKNRTIDQEKEFVILKKKFGKHFDELQEKIKTIKSFKEIYSGLEDSKTADEYIEKFKHITENTKSYVNFDEVINVMVNIAVSFVSYDISQDYSKLPMFDKVLRVLINTMYIPTALQYYVYLHKTLPSSDTLKKMLEKLVDTPDQASIVQNILIF